QVRARVVHERHLLVQAHGGSRLARDVPRAPVQRLRHLPVIEIERVARIEVERVLAAFRADPEAVLAGEHVHVRAPLARCHRCPHFPGGLDARYSQIPRCVMEARDSRTPLPKAADQFRDYEHARAGVAEFYRLNHTHQTLAFVLSKKTEYLSLSRRMMTVWEA